MDRDDGQDEAYRLAGDRLGKFVILGELGRGSMGVVYEAFQEDLKRKVAVKVLPANIALDGKQVRRFRREAESASRLRHEQIIPIYEIGEFEGTHYFAMELVDGRPFGEGLGRDREAVREAARLARDAALGLAHAHERGVVHRDIKPGNLLVDRNGRLVVADFGLARLSESASLTSTDAIVGIAAASRRPQKAREPNRLPYRPSSSLHATIASGFPGATPASRIASRHSRPARALHSRAMTS